MAQRQTRSNSRLSIQSRHRRHERSTRDTHNKPTNKRRRKRNRLRPSRNTHSKNIFKNKIQYATSAISCLKNSDCCILVTEWEEFKKLKPEDFTKNMKQPNLIDGRRIYNPKEFTQKMKYTAIGLGPLNSRIK